MVVYPSINITEPSSAVCISSSESSLMGSGEDGGVKNSKLSIKWKIHGQY